MEDGTTSKTTANRTYEIAIIGAGLAGCELAYQLSQNQRKKDILLVSQALDHLGNLFDDTVDAQPNAELFPSDSLFATTCTHLLEKQTKSTVDNWTLHCALKERLEYTPNIHLLQSTVTQIIPAESHLKLHTWEGPTLNAQKVVLAVGSFLRGRLQLGTFTEEAGRLSEVAYDFLADSLQEQGFQFVRQTEKATLETENSSYKVTHSCFAAEEFDAKTYQLQRIPQLYALGRCTIGPMKYRDVIKQAQELATLL